MRRYIAILLSVMTFAEVSAREVYSLDNGWKFFFRYENSSDAARNVNLPHTWNLDALTGSLVYRQTTADYLRDLYIPAEWRDKRLFLRFYGVQNVADVFINGEHVGEHRGGFTAFTFEITDRVRYDYENSLHVMVSNAFENDIFPLSTEMNLYGGIYRNAELIVTDKTVISPTCFGTDGLFVSQHSVTRESAEAGVTVHLSTTENIQSCNLHISVKGPDGYVAASKSVKAKLDGKPVTVPLSIANPELWNTYDPKLYRVEAVAGRDTVSVWTGFRSIEVTPERHLQINGKTVEVRGAALWHDRASKGSALTEADYDEDLAIASEAGINALRSATAPHAQYLYDRCDREGVLVWIDFPLVQSPFAGDVAYISSPRLKENGRQQMREILYQNFNHPSVVMWGVFSMLKPREDLLDYLRELNGMAKSLDRSRPTVACSNRDGEINFITDLIVWYQTFGWDCGQIADLDIWQEILAGEWRHLRQAVAYGPCSSAGIADPASKARERQTVPYHVRQRRFHEGYVNHLSDNEVFWGIWLNNLFDFGSTRYLTGLQDGGLVSFDRREKRDIFYLYRALWNGSQPTVHINGKQNSNRMRSSQTVRIYSSADEPLLTVNGDTVALARTGVVQYESDPVEMRGRSEIVVRAGGASDTQTITIGNILKHR